MKKTALAVLALLISQSAFSENIIKTYAPIKGSSGSSNDWVAADAQYSDWTKSGPLHNCAAATPATDTYVQGVSFQQTVSDCSQDYTRSVQSRELNSVTGAYRNVGQATEESKTEVGISTTQTAVGTRLETDILFGGREGRAYLGSTGSSYVGMYSRANVSPMISIGDVQYTKGGDRIQMYFTMAGQPKTTGTCYVKVGASGPNGWGPTTATTTSKDYVNAINKIVAYVSDGTTRTYTMGSVTVSEGGAIRQATANCTDLYNFYNTPGYITKASLLSQ